MKFEKKSFCKQYLSKDLIKFLEEEGLMDYVEQETKKQWKICGNYIKWSGSKYEIPIKEISCLFLWRTTEQEDDFWSEKAIKFNKLIHNYPF